MASVRVPGPPITFRDAWVLVLSPLTTAKEHSGTQVPTGLRGLSRAWRCGQGVPRRSQGREKRVPPHHRKRPQEGQPARPALSSGVGGIGAWGSHQPGLASGSDVSWRAEGRA